MPYAPGVQSTVAQSIAQAGQSLQQALQWMSSENDKTKELRTQLGVLDPGNKDKYNKMGKAELQGTLVGLHQQEQQRQTALQTALAQQNLAAGAREAGAESAMSQVMKQALPAMQNNATSVTGLPAEPGNPLAVNVRTQPPVSGSSIMAAMAANPEAVNSKAGGQIVNDFMRTAGATQRGAPQFMTGPDGTTWAYNQFTGQFEPSPIDKVKAAAAAKGKPAKAGAAPEGQPVYSADKKLYWEPYGGWRPVPQTKPGLFDAAAGGGGGGMSYVWKDGQLIPAQ